MQLWVIVYKSYLMVEAWGCVCWWRKSKINFSLPTKFGVHIIIFCVVCKFWWKEFVLELFQDFKVAGCYSWSLGQTVMQIVLKSVLCIWDLFLKSLYSSYNPALLHSTVAILVDIWYMIIPHFWINITDTGCFF